MYADNNNNIHTIYLFLYIDCMLCYIHLYLNK